MNVQELSLLAGFFLKIYISSTDMSAVGIYELCNNCAEKAPIRLVLEVTEAENVFESSIFRSESQQN